MLSPKVWLPWDKTNKNLTFSGILTKLYDNVFKYYNSMYIEILDESMCET